jgi:hypothetical protein
MVLPVVNFATYRRTHELVHVVRLLSDLAETLRSPKEKQLPYLGENKPPIFNIR